MSDLCVYTTLLGNYESLNEQPVAATAQIPFICLTDDPNLRSESWEMRMVKPIFSSDPVRSQREIKLRPHVHLPEFARSLYIDNSVILKQPPEGLFELANSSPEGFLLPRHSFRQTVLDEFVEVAQLGLDDSNRIFEQLNHYLLTFPEVLEQGPWWTAIMVRDHNNARLRSALDIWALHVMRYSRRDQLSVNMALFLGGIQPAPLWIDNHESSFHTWPHKRNRNERRGERSPAVSMMPLAARVRVAEQRVANFQTHAAESLSEIRRLRQELAGAAATRDALLNSTCWRLTRPLRYLLMRMPSVHSLVQRTPKGDQPLDDFKPTEPAGTSNAPQSATTSAAAERVLSEAGHWIYVNATDNRGRRLIEAGGSLNPSSLLAWQILLAEGGWTHLFDVGANYGEMLVNVLLPSGAEVIAVEPSPVIRAKLERTLREAGISAKVLDVALSDSKGEGRLRIDAAWSGSTRLARSNETGGAPVRTTTLGSVLRHLPMPSAEISALIKVDVEGDEVNVLRSSTEELCKLKRFAALVEVLHASPADLAWIEQTFAVEMLRFCNPPKLVPAPRGQLVDMLASGDFYAQDIVLRLKRN